MRTLPEVDPAQNYAALVEHQQQITMLHVSTNLPDSGVDIPTNLENRNAVPFDVKTPDGLADTIATLHVGCRSVVPASSFNTLDAIRLACDSFALISHAGNICLQPIDRQSLAVSSTELTANAPLLPLTTRVCVRLGENMLLTALGVRPDPSETLPLHFTTAPFQMIRSPYVLSVTGVRVN
jgi:hypothetical protein